MKNIKRKIFISSLILSMLTSCSNFVKGEWINLNTANIKVVSTVGARVSPFDTTFFLKYLKDDKISQDNLENLLSSDLSHYHKLFDRHYYYNDEDNNIINNIKVLNDNYGSNKFIKYDTEIIKVLKYGLRYLEESDARFNIFIGSLEDFYKDIIAKIYDYERTIEELDPAFDNENKTILDNFKVSFPTKEECLNLLTINEEESTIRFNALEDIKDDEGKVLIDRSSTNSLYRPVITLGGIVKGYMVDLLKAKFKENNYTYGYINGGTSSLSLISKPDYFTEQVINISFALPTRDYFRDAGFKITITDELNISTSGNYQAGSSYSFVKDNKTIQRHHIIDLKTFEPSQYYSSLTIISNLDSINLDYLSTSFSAMSPESITEFINAQKEINKDLYLSVIYIENMDENNKFKFGQLGDEIKYEIVSERLYK